MDAEMERLYRRLREAEREVNFIEAQIGQYRDDCQHEDEGNGWCRKCWCYIPDWKWSSEGAGDV